MRHAIEAYIWLPELAGLLLRPVQHRRRNGAAGEPPSDREPMNVEGLILRDFGPNSRIRQLDFDGSGRLAVRMGKVEQSSIDVRLNATQGKLVIPPQRYPTLAKPSRRLEEDFRDDVSVGMVGLNDSYLSHVVRFQRACIPLCPVCAAFWGGRLIPCSTHAGYLRFWSDCRIAAIARATMGVHSS